MPLNTNNEIEHKFIRKLYDDDLTKRIPTKHKEKDIDLKLKFRKFYVTNFFDLKRGDFHSIDALSDGKYPTVSRDTQNNDDWCWLLYSEKCLFKRINE